jgi:hypothetical protein
MKFTESQIERAKKSYNKFLRTETLADHDVETIGRLEAERRMEFHNNIVYSILQGNKEVEKEWKMFFLKEVVKADQKEQASKDKLKANKDASTDVLEPIKSQRRLGEFGKWLNTSGNPFRKQHFNKKYTVEAVNTFLAI